MEMSRGSPNPHSQQQSLLESGGSLGRHGGVDPEKLYQKYEAMKEDYESLRKRYGDLIGSHSATVNKLELAQEEINRVNKLYEEALQETSNAIRERNGLKQQCTAAIRQWDSALRERNEYKEAHGKIQQQHDEAMKEINQAMAVRIKSNKEIKRLTEERDAALQEYSLIMSERDSVHRELEKLTDDLSQSKKQIKSLETQNKELTDKLQEALQETDVSKRRRDWAFNERDKIVRERESLRTLCDRLRRERDRAVSDLAEALSESEDIKKQKNVASKELKELKERMEFEKENRSGRFQFFSNSSSFSESRDSAIDSDLPSGHYSIKLPNVRGADHGLVLEPGVYVSRIVPGSPASKEMNLNVGDRVLFINDTPIDNVQDAILALSEDIDPIMLTLSRSAGQLQSPIHSTTNKSQNSNRSANNSNNHTHASESSLKSDKSDPNNVISSSSSSRRNEASKSRPTSTGLREIFKRLPKKKNSSPEEAILATLDSAIASGGMSENIGIGTNSGSSHSSRKKRSKNRNSSRNSGEQSNVNKNGTWPRLSKNSCSYTLPKDVSPGTISSHRSNAYDNGANNVTTYETRNTSIYGQYNPARSSNTEVIRRSGKERIPLSSMIWDMNPHPSKSVSSIATGNSNNKMSLVNQNMSTYSNNRSGGNIYHSGIALDNHGLPMSSNVPPQHRYSFGVFDPPSSKGKGAPERNSVVPTMSDGSSIDFSVKSGNIETLDYYVRRMKNHNNSSESDHLDKVVTPPSLGTSADHANSASDSSILDHRGSSSPMRVANTLDRYPNRYPSSSRYSGHHHDILSVHNAPPGSSRSNSGNITGVSVGKQQGNTYTFEPSFHHAHSRNSAHGVPSTAPPMISSRPTSLFRNSDDLILHPNNLNYGGELSGTFPRKKEVQRIRIPSNQSVTSRSSTEKFELRNSPMPTYHIEFLEPGTGSHNSGYDYGTWPRKPASGELRKVRIDKFDNSQPLGIQIFCNDNESAGVFVSKVTEHSLAAQVGLQNGDQLLEVCGINMRSATYELAASVLRQCGDSITMLVQYSPDKYRELTKHGKVKSYNQESSSDESHSDGESSSSSDDQDDHNHSSVSDHDSRCGSRSGSPTPCNSPQSTLVRKKSGGMKTSYTSGSGGKGGISVKKGNANLNSDRGIIPSNSATNSLSRNSSQQQQQNQLSASFGLGPSLSLAQDNPPSEQSTLRSTRSSGGASNVSSDHNDGKSKMHQEKNSRFLTLHLMKNSSNLGVCLVGGNVVGIFIHSVQPESVADRAGLRTGDQILEYNGTDLRQATAEEAAFELAKPLDKVGILVQYNMQRYNEIKDKPGDGFYMRALIDYPPLSNDSHFRNQSNTLDAKQLTFSKGEILYVDNTMYNGKPGRWRAWKVDHDSEGGRNRIWGIIPAKFKVEEEMMFKRGLGDLDSDRRASTITRRSFFRRKSHHRSSSRELASFSDASMNSYGDLTSATSPGFSVKEDPALMLLNCYQRVERLDFMSCPRPVVILGALSDLIAERLVQDFPYEFSRVPIEVMHCSGPMLENGLAQNVFVDYKRKGSHYECISMSAVKEISSKKLHGILDISTAGVDRLQICHLHPIVILVKFKSPKQIREIKDLRRDKISTKAGKELYDHSLKVETEYKELITVCLPGGTNISYLATQVKAAVETEQMKTLWVPM